MKRSIIKGKVHQIDKGLKRGGSPAETANIKAARQRFNPTSGTRARMFGRREKMTGR